MTRTLRSRTGEHQESLLCKLETTKFVALMSSKEISSCQNTSSSSSKRVSTLESRCLSGDMWWFFSLIARRPPILLYSRTYCRSSANWRRRLAQSCAVIGPNRFVRVTAWSRFSSVLSPKRRGSQRVQWTLVLVSSYDLLWWLGYHVTMLIYLSLVNQGKRMIIQLVLFEDLKQTINIIQWMVNKPHCLHNTIQCIVYMNCTCIL